MNDPKSMNFFLMSESLALAVSCFLLLLGTYVKINYICGQFEIVTLTGQINFPLQNIIEENS